MWLIVLLTLHFLQECIHFLSSSKMRFIWFQHFYSPKTSSCISVQYFGHLSIHFAQVPTHGLSGTQMSLISFQPDHPFHDNLVQSVFATPQIASKVTNLSASVFAGQDMIRSRLTVQHIPIPGSQENRRRTYNHFWARIGIVFWQIHSKCVLFIIAANHSHLDFRFPSRIDPRNFASKVFLQ